MTTWDLLFRNASIATMDDPLELEQIHNGSVAVKDGIIVWLGPEAALPAGSAAKEIDLAGRVLTPGLVDPHTHIVYGDEGLEDFEVLSQGGGRPELIER